MSKGTACGQRNAIGMQCIPQSTKVHGGLVYSFERKNSELSPWTWCKFHAFWEESNLKKVQRVQGHNQPANPSQAIKQHSILCKQHMEPRVMELYLTGEGSSHGSKRRATQQPPTDTFMHSLKQSMASTS
eukprot:scaffold47346_cov17-Tisochrysis_lutea.AAC.1